MKKRTRVISILLQICICMMILGSSFVVFADEKLSGTVVETMNSGGYTYALLEKEGVKKWVAVPQVLLSVGDQVEFSSGMDMGQYTSKTLGRTFESITFSGGVVAVKKFEKKEDAAEIPAEKLDIAKADGPNGYTIAELYEKKSDLAGKKVEVTGKVYKVSKFMGSTWIRMKDGTGSRKKGNHKLVVTSQETAQKDDIVTIAGVVAVDKNIAGLSYEVVVENATVAKNE